MTVTLSDLVRPLVEASREVHVRNCACNIRFFNDADCLAIRARMRAAVLAMVEAHGFWCGSKHQPGRDCPGHLKQRAEARKLLA